MKRLTLLVVLLGGLWAQPVDAATSFANLTSGHGGSDPYTTGVIAPTSGRVGWLSLAFFDADGPGDSPSVTGGFATWTCNAGRNIEVGTVDYFHVICVGTGAVTTEAVTLTWAETIGEAIWIIDESTETDTSTPVAGGLNQCEASGTSTTPTCTLSAFADSTNNASYASTVADQSPAPEGGGAWVELAEVSLSGVQISSQWRLGQDTSPSSTMTSGLWSFIAVEVDSTNGGGAPAAAPRLLLLGVN